LVVDFLPMLIYVLVHVGVVSIEVEADYMWGLLHPALLTGEGGYYLTSLSSAVLMLKHFREMNETKGNTLTSEVRGGQYANVRGKSLRGLGGRAPNK
jgi:hypothetical protein